ncbi:MAG: methyltransferase [Phycisphaerales bacterium]|nr:methyltransferase [Phycisphaerales bacterium]
MHHVAGFHFRFPANGQSLDQDQEWCQVQVDGNWQPLRFHDYDKVYQIPGLYEALFYHRLRCCSPYMVVHLLQEVLTDYPESVSDLRVLDVGAGNGIVGQELRAQGAPFVVGVDILSEARDAAMRDRPGIYDEYLVADLTDLSDTQRHFLTNARLNCLCIVAALGYGDIPIAAFVQACNIIDEKGWLAFNIKEDFLDESRDATGFSRLIQTLVRERVIQVQSYRRYRHRMSVQGEPLHYVAVTAC